MSSSRKGGKDGTNPSDTDIVAKINQREKSKQLLDQDYSLTKSNGKSIKY